MICCANQPQFRKKGSFRSAKVMVIHMLFSVIMPVYNGERFVENAISYVKAQTFTDYELVIVNDGSKDGTAAILKKYEDDPKIKIVTQPNGGVSRARNTAMANAAGDYFAFLDCDDVWLPDHLATIADMICRYPDGGTYATLANFRLADGREISNIGYFDDRPDAGAEIVYIQNFFAEYDRDKRAKTHAPSCACVSRAAAEKTGGFKVGCKIGEDLAFFLIAGIYFPVVLSRKITSVYEKGNSTATKDTSFDPDWFFFEDVKLILDDPSLSEDVKTHLRCVMQWYTMRRCRHLIIDGRKKEARACYAEIGQNKALTKDKLLTFGLLMLPVSVVKKIFAARWRNVG